MRNTFYLKNLLVKWKTLVLMIGLVFFGIQSGQSQNLVWEENFDGPSINPDTWTFDFGDGCERGLCGWGNQELQYYTSRPENARIENGNLLIEARKENFQTRQFTSARMRTYGRVHFKYGVLEARIKVPDLKEGLWPAFWMLGTTGVWPASGEIDIMEMGSKAGREAGQTNNRVGAAVHWAYQEFQADHGTHYDSPTPLTDDYHVYKMTWDETFIRVFIDDHEYFAIDISDVETNSLEEFHRPQYILLNLAVGGLYTGLMGVGDITAPLPGKMLVDYIKLYQSPGDELFLGKDNQVAGEFGVYTENPAITERLVYGQDANLYVWNNLSNITEPAPTPFEGSEVLAFRAAPGNWFGFGVANTGPKNLQNFADGALKFHFKTSFTGQFKVGLNSGFGDSWINFAPGSEGYGLTRDGEWHEVIIPLSAFNQPNLGMHIDLGSIGQSFMLAGDAPNVNADFYIDNIYFSGGTTSNPAPTVSITSPANDAIIHTPSDITITANAADENGTVAKVDFYNGTTLLGSDDTAPYSFTWTSPAAGIYSLTAKATDNEGKEKASNAINVFVSAPGNNAPSISITSPENNSGFLAPATINIAADASDSDGNIYKVDFYNGETLLSSDDSAPYGSTLNLTNAGTYSIIAKATDNGGLTASSTVNITVAEPVKPTVSITAPASNSEYVAPATVSIQADAATTEGTITKVEFYAGQTFLGTDETSPYSIDWNVVDGGDYSLTAKAYNSLNASEVSGAVAITVTENTTPNLALNKPAFSSSDENPASLPVNAVDGNLGTRWSSAFADPQWIYVDLEKSYDINRVKITWEGALGKDYVVQTSEDATNWTDIKTVTGNSALINDWKGLAGSGRYLRIYGTARGTVYGYSIFELEVYGTEKAAYCGTADNGDYSYKAETEGGNVTITFHPEAPIEGSNMAIVYIREGAEGGYPGYGMTKTENGDFTYSKAIAEGTELSIYFTYAVPSGGERNSSATPHSYSVGTTCGNSSNLAPAVSIISPVSSDSFDAPANITIEADASDSDGSLVKVEFYNGTTLLGTDTEAPYSFAWSNVEAGAFALTAKALDNGGLSTTSSIVNITVEGDANNGGYCGTSADGDYSYKAVTTGENVTFTFHPEAPIAGSNFALIYIREGESGGYPGYLMTQTGVDFTFTKAIPAGTNVSIYFTYRVSENGVEKNSSANPHNYTVGISCTNEGPVDADGDGFTVDVDCDDTNANINPDAVEVCDGIDNNCDGQIDEGVQTTFYADADGDGFGNAEVTALTCSVPEGYVAVSGDCDDSKANVYPGAAEVCDGLDNNCDGQIDEGVKTIFYADNDGDGFGNAEETTLACSAPEGYVAISGDCEDNDSSINPDGIDLCDGIDRNCDGKFKLPMETPVISITPSNNVYTGGDVKTIYLGYGPQSVTFNASTSIPADYEWTPSTGLNSANNASTVFTPLAAGTYTFTVKATNEDNCAATADVTINVIDVRCGNGKKMDKVIVSHGRKELCISANAVKAHLSHGDKLGTIGGNSANARTIIENPESEDAGFILFPNPSKDGLSIKSSLDLEGASLQIMDVYGIKVKEAVLRGNTINVSSLSPGSYTLVIIKGKEIIKKHFIKE
ncbi:MAG TPA: Ig-like domain-containing protein [Cytophagales bacterium]|nr:Ig-like domain-containing protein [Cytophagales bacterium]